MKTFVLSEEQVKKYEDWRASNPTGYYGAIGGGEHFIFTPTSIGMVVRVKHDNGAELDLTEEW